MALIGPSGLLLSLAEFSCFTGSAFFLFFATGFLVSFDGVAFGAGVTVFTAALCLTGCFGDCIGESSGIGESVSSVGGEEMAFSTDARTDGVVVCGCRGTTGGAGFFAGKGGV